MSSNLETPAAMPPTDASYVPRWVTVLFILAFALVGYLLYANYEQRQGLRQSREDANKKTQAMAAELDKTNTRIADLKGQLDVTSQKLGLTQDELARARTLSENIKRDQLRSDKALKEQIGQVEADTSTKIGEVSTEITKTNTDVAATKSDLA